MLASRIFDCAPQLTTLSAKCWPEIEETIRAGRERCYKLDIADLDNEPELLLRLLKSFEVDAVANITSTNTDACLGAIRWTLPVRPENLAMLAIFNLGELPNRYLQLFLALIKILLWLADDVSYLTPSDGRHQVRLRVVFFGTGSNYPEELWS